MGETETSERATDQAATEVKPQRKRITRRRAVEQAARSYFEAMDRRDPGAMIAHWHEDGVEDAVPLGVMRGHDELRDFYASMFAAMPDARTTLTRLVAGERNCAVEWRIEGTFSGEAFTGIEPTGK